jgi:hypothetical protein
MDEVMPQMAGAVHTNWHKPIAIDLGLVSECFDHDPKLVNCKIAQPSPALILGPKIGEG